VTLTRARHKLILIGSCQTLSQSPLLQSLLKVINTQKWVSELNVNSINSDIELLFQMVNLPTGTLQDPRFTQFWNCKL
jgi:superfamily I DNA and/or RNA helicase